MSIRRPIFVSPHAGHGVSRRVTRLMVGLKNGHVGYRPIAGTRRRGHDDVEDKNLEAELRADPKERAEHVMLVDLGRNDLGACV